ncbi:hypothetical protein VIBHAR_06220 [Vibrio campbellii ATCC BAA-1116]|uniref:Uncharacterized protein n=1 Tax=Vibrio campbellii (strain ATCC BAA-1116) TaxID=2902295 RepID=A7N6M1_VIBC1|nr:hypothetical protein VIBHAR_06220 [Vibrio campbellii ATCC BAA-1116]
MIADQNESAYFSRYLHDSSMLVVGSPQGLALLWSPRAFNSRQWC